MRKATTQDFDHIYDILQSSFPKDERRGYEAQKQLLKHPNYRIYVWEQFGKICAFISFWKIDGFAFVEHFAVAESYRNCGLGSKMLCTLKETLCVRICLEVELPETDLARRRVEFYKRNGFYYNAYEYEQPAYSKDQVAVPLRIMSTMAPLTEVEFINVKKQIYKMVYQK